MGAHDRSDGDYNQGATSTDTVVITSTPPTRGHAVSPPQAAAASAYVWFLPHQRGRRQHGIRGVRDRDADHADGVERTDAIWSGPVRGGSRQRTCTFMFTLARNASFPQRNVR